MTMKPFEPFDPARVWVKTENVLSRLAEPGTAQKLRVYDYLQEALWKVDVRTDAKYQRRYRGFYRVRQRPETWHARYFDLLEVAKRTPMPFDVALRAFCKQTGRVEASFVSKLVATINPKAPVWDQFVLRNLKLRKPSYHADQPYRLAECITVYKEICARVAALAASSEGAAWVGGFDVEWPEFEHFTTTKKIDVFLWLARDHGRSAARTVPKLGRDRPKNRANVATDTPPTDSSPKQSWSRRERITRTGRTRGAKEKSFSWEWDGKTLDIRRENGHHDEFSIKELHRILKSLEDQFQTGWFPLANDVAKMPKGTEKPGLGMTIFKIRPGDTTHAQASSYLGVVFEELGLTTWNGESRGIEWRLNGKVLTIDELAGRLREPGP